MFVTNQQADRGGLAEIQEGVLDTVTRCVPLLSLALSPTRSSRQARRSPEASFASPHTARSRDRLAPQARASLASLPS